MRGNRLAIRLQPTPDNIRIVLHSVNVAMNEWGLDYYLAVAKAAGDHNSVRAVFTGE